MPPKHIPTDGQGNAIENPISRSKAKPKPYSGVCRWMSLYWFYQNPINPVVITLKSKL
jgi:hypothetical protein